ncbi:hypothetical protein ACQ259_15825 [Stutzerimonas stutzeri]|uniref:hypothetical protein n=1 Tax=Stutzerimonas stutzeri subgroup TaxID=578833 RepID=UPI0011B08BDA|nr:hypothetical protein [Stutzerimonas kunmingensis]
MQFILRIRPINHSDLGSECPYLVDEDDYAMYANGLLDDIASEVGVLSVSRSGDSLNIDVDDKIDEKQVKEIVKPYFSNDRFCKYRFVSLDVMS